MRAAHAVDPARPDTHANGRDVNHHNTISAPDPLTRPHSFRDADLARSSARAALVDRGARSASVTAVGA
jgi:hypothetical protein